MQFLESTHSTSDMRQHQDRYPETPIGPEIIQRQLHYESRALANFWDLFNFGRLFGDLAWICVGFPRKPGAETRPFPRSENPDLGHPFLVLD